MPLSRRLKRTLAIVALLAVGFVPGALLGGAVVALQFGQTLANAIHIFTMAHRAEREQEAYEAYLQQDPAVAAWALEGLVRFLEQELELTAPEEDRRSIQTDLALTHARLALTYQRLGRTEGFAEQMERARERGEQSGQEWLSGEGLLETVRRLDEGELARVQAPGS